MGPIRPVKGTFGGAPLWPVAPWTVLTSPNDRRVMDRPGNPGAVGTTTRLRLTQVHDNAASAVPTAYYEEFRMGIYTIFHTRGQPLFRMFHNWL